MALTLQDDGERVHLADTRAVAVRPATMLEGPRPAYLALDDGATVRAVANSCPRDGSRGRNALGGGHHLAGRQPGKRTGWCCAKGTATPASR